MSVRLSLFAWVFCAAGSLALAGPIGYYRQPAIHENLIVFVSEGDLWKVPASGGIATRLTSHPGDESNPRISADGALVAFTAQYEGPTEIYTMPLTGGLPTRRTYTGGRLEAVGWSRDGRLLYASDASSTLPDMQLFWMDFGDAKGQTTRTPVPLAQAAEGAIGDDGQTLYFTRLRFQGSQTRRYKGGTAQNLWSFRTGDAEAKPLTADYAGTSRRPMPHNGRLYFASDRDGVMNIWSILQAGGDLKQHTFHKDFEALGPYLDRGRIVYQHGADLRLYDIAADRDSRVSITLDTDLDQTRENWVEKPMNFLTSAHLSADGSRVALTMRGRVFVVPHRQGRIVEVTKKGGVRYRDGRFLPGSDALVGLSDESGEVELWRLPVNGVGEREQLTNDSRVLRIECVPSPDGKYVAYHDKNFKLFIYDLAAKTAKEVDSSDVDTIGDLRWSADSAFLAYSLQTQNLFRVIRIYSVAENLKFDATSDRFDSFSPAWSPDGKWLYFVSDRNLTTLVESPWGNYQPEPFLDKTGKIFGLALRPGQRWPFQPSDELEPPGKPTGTSTSSSAPASAAVTAPSQPATSAPAPVTIVREGLMSRLFEAPIPPGNYAALGATEKSLFWLSNPTGERKRSLVAAAIARENVEVKAVCPDVRAYEISTDAKKLLIHKGESLYIVDASADEAKLEKRDVNLAGLQMSVIPRDEWKQMFHEAWRLERDYFYDPAMHGVDWPAMRTKYAPIAERAATRAELNDAIAQMVAELSALHIFVRGGDLREGQDQIANGYLGGEWIRDAAAGGYRITRVFQSDPDEPQLLSPLAQPSVEIGVGDVIEQINGVPTLSAADAAMLLRGQASRQVLVRVKPFGGGAARDAIVSPIDRGAAADLRYRDWEYARRLTVERLGNGQLGYVHLRAMGGGNFTEWAKNFYPVFNRSGLIIDVRHNSGGNIDSWILGRLLRKAWFTWSQRVGQPPSWNMQYAFRGHLVVLCDEWTASDGEAFTEGFKRLGLGKVIGKRTWGGEIWLTSSNTLVDEGIATAAEFGVFGPEGQWLIEGHGAEPDIEVDNPPHATFKGEDAQLQAAIDHLQKLIKEKPVISPKPPLHPNKSK